MLILTITLAVLLALVVWGWIAHARAMDQYETEHFEAEAELIREKDRYAIKYASLRQALRELLKDD